MSEEKSIAHKGGGMNWVGQDHYPDGLVDWDDAEPPDIGAGRTTGRLRHCGYCGSMHPADLAEALKAGAKGSWADFKYGWPHKWYVDNVPNPHAGMLESRMGASDAVPNCPKTGAPCEQGSQGFHRPKCDCMRDTPEKVVSGVYPYGSNAAMIAVPDGFSRSNGKQEYRWIEAGKPAKATTDGKFYTVHLQDATPEDRAIIEQHMGLAFTFHEDGQVSWKRVAAATEA